jgi:17beta-estradiol 17-dehydrogenase / very-long-chain 3-oxoacyl-CoA reductase
VITGCTEGIGKSYAQELARDNFNLILISRNQQKLENLKVDLLKDFGPREIILIKADFTKSYESDFYDKIANQISPFDISILVNNIGVANFSQFHEE